MYFIIGEADFNLQAGRHLEYICLRDAVGMQQSVEYVCSEIMQHADTVAKRVEGGFFTIQDLSAITHDDSYWIQPVLTIVGKCLL